MASDKQFSKKTEDFVCEVCGRKVRGNGYTDHCPDCLWSKHVDINPGDRASECKGLLKPVRTTNDRNGFFIEYVCEACKARKRVRAASEDNEELLFKLLS